MANRELGLGLDIAFGSSPMGDTFRLIMPSMHFSKKGCLLALGNLLHDITHLCFKITWFSIFIIITKHSDRLPLQASSKKPSSTIRGCWCIWNVFLHLWEFYGKIMASFQIGESRFYGEIMAFFWIVQSRLGIHICVTYLDMEGWESHHIYRKFSFYQLDKHVGLWRGKENTNISACVLDFCFLFLVLADDRMQVCLLN